MAATRGRHGLAAGDGRVWAGPGAREQASAAQSARRLRRHVRQHGAGGSRPRRRVGLQGAPAVGCDGAGGSGVCRHGANRPWSQAAEGMDCLETKFPQKSMVSIFS